MSVISFPLLQVRKAVAPGVEIMVRGTTMIGQATVLIPPLTNLLVTPSPTRQSHQEPGTEMGPSGTETTATDGFDRPPSGSASPWCLCCLSWLLLPPCGDSWLSQSGGGGFLSCSSLKHIMKKRKNHSIWLHQQKKMTKQANLAIIRNLFTAQNKVSEYFSDCTSLKGGII